MPTRDVAQREVDQRGFRIVNIGTPEAEGDATRTDNTATPLANDGPGSPGKSLLAAPADHVHPASPGGGTTLFTFDDPSEQSVTGGDEVVVAEFLANFITFGAGTAFLNISALAKVSDGSTRLRLRKGGTPGTPDGDTVISGDGNSRDFEPISPSGGALEVPPGVLLVKLTIQNERPTATVNVRAKSITFSAGAGVPQD